MPSHCLLQARYVTYYYSSNYPHVSIVIFFLYWFISLYFSYSEPSLLSGLKCAACIQVVIGMQYVNAGSC